MVVDDDGVTGSVVPLHLLHGPNLSCTTVSTFKRTISQAMTSMEACRHMADCCGQWTKQVWSDQFPGTTLTRKATVTRRDESRQRISTHSIRAGMRRASSFSRSKANRKIAVFASQCQQNLQICLVQVVTAKQIEE